MRNRLNVDISSDTHRLLRIKAATESKSLAQLTNEILTTALGSESEYVPPLPQRERNKDWDDITIRHYAYMFVSVEAERWSISKREIASKMIWFASDLWNKAVESKEDLDNIVVPERLSL